MGSFYFHFIWIPLLRVSSRLLVLSLAFRSVALTQSPFSLPCTHIRVLSHCMEDDNSLLIAILFPPHSILPYPLILSCHAPWLYPACDRHVGPISSLEWVIRFEVDHDKSLSTFDYLFRICLSVYTLIWFYVSFILSIYFQCILYLYYLYVPHLWNKDFQMYALFQEFSWVPEYP